MAALIILLAALAIASPPAPDEAALGRAMEDVRWLVEEIGPRPADSDAERQAAMGVQARLEQAGWQVGLQGCSLCTIACRGQPSRLFLAHIDSVPGSPGAVDNAAGVAALLELARSTAATDLCLGFPPGEEAGLLGSRAMAESWPHPLPELVVALDLTGHGRLAVTGLGPAWGAEDLRWLLADGELTSHYLYRAVSRARPEMERSDHLPFAQRGARSLHLLGRGEGGVFPRYHQPSDTQVQPESLADLLRVLERLATAALPDGEPDSAATHGRWVMPAWVGYLVLLGCGSFALRDLLRPCEGRPVLGALWGLLRSFVRALLGAALFALPLAAFTLSGWMASSEAERTAAEVMGIPATGWWAGAPWGVGLGLGLWLLFRKAVGGRGSATLAAFTLALLALSIDPLFAFPFALAGLMARLHPLVGVLPALALLWPDHLRELAFHGLLPPTMWALISFLLWPAFGTSAGPPPKSPPP